MRCYIYICALFLILVTACTTETPKPCIESPPTVPELHLIADTIVYDVIIRNTNPYDSWAQECLKGLQHSQLIDSLFGLVYDNQATAYDYFTGKKLHIRKLEKLETKEWFSRKNIGKLQFTEKWYFNKAGMELRKEVISVALGHELYGDSGDFRGYKPIFKIYLQP